MKRYMIADSSDIVRKVVNRILTIDGETIVHESKTGSEAVEQCSFEMPDVIIISTTLPDRPADSIITEIRQMAKAERKNPIIISCMVEMSVGEIMRAKRAGANGYLLKPFTRPILLNTLAQFDEAIAA